MGYKSEAVKGIGAGWLLVIILGVIGVITSAIFWGIGVATSGVKGQGDAIKINNSAENWTAKQAFFEDKYQAAITADAKIALFQKAVDANPKDRTAQDNLTGITSQCMNYVAEYNAESNKFLSQDWKSADLPTKLGLTPNTDCK